MRRVPWALAALPALALARLLPAHGFGLGLRLAAATGVLLVPGALVARALGQAGAAATLAWSLGALLVGLGLVLVAHTALWPALVVLALVAAAALPAAWRRRRERSPRGTVAVLAGGVVLGILLWYVAAPLGGDALFHLARVRKLEAFGDLSLGSVNEFADGGLHPGYAFPLWHGLLALVASLAGVDAAAVLLHEATVLVPLALLVAYEAGHRVFGTVSGGISVLLAQVAITGLAAGHGGAYVSLALPATASRQLLVPAVVALVFAYVADREWPVLAAVVPAAVALTLVHPTYVLFLGAPLAGYLVVTAVFRRGDLRPAALVLGAYGAAAAAALAPLYSVVRETASHTPGAVERARGLEHYASQLDVFSPDRYRIAPEVFGRTGAVAVAALVLIPLAAFSVRRREGALVLGGALAVFALTLPSFVFPEVADAVSLSQARRLAGFLPFAFAFAAGLAVLARRLGIWALPLALGAGIGLQLAWPGDFGAGLREGGPALATWIGVFGGAAGLALSPLTARLLPQAARGSAYAGLAAACFVLPVAVHGFSNWSAREVGHRYDLTPGLVEALRERVPAGAVVFSDLETSYRIAAYAPLYVAAAPPEHVADTTGNRPYRRRDDVRRFLRTGDLSIPRRYGAEWLVVRRDSRLGVRAPALYTDGRFALHRL
ncbi:MAG: hypothetical protein ABR521_10960 [Gaiellaceae bacterium]